MDHSRDLLPKEPLSPCFKLDNVKCNTAPALQQAGKADSLPCERCSGTIELLQL